MASLPAPHASVTNASVPAGSATRPPAAASVKPLPKLPQAAGIGPGKMQTVGYVPTIDARIAALEQKLAAADKKNQELFNRCRVLEFAMKKVTCFTHLGCVRSPISTGNREHVTR